MQSLAARSTTPAEDGDQGRLGSYLNSEMSETPVVFTRSGIDYPRVVINHLNKELTTKHTWLDEASNISCIDPTCVVTGLMITSKTTSCHDCGIPSIRRCVHKIVLNHVYRQIYTLANLDKFLAMVVSALSFRVQFRIQLQPSG